MDHLKLYKNSIKIAIGNKTKPNDKIIYSIQPSLTTLSITFINNFAVKSPQSLVW